MIEYDPYPAIKGFSGALGSERNYLKIDAKATLLSGDGRKKEIPFRSRWFSHIFTPISTEVKWMDVTELQIAIDLDYLIADTEGGSLFDMMGLMGTGRIKTIKSWQLDWGDDGVTLTDSVEIDDGSRPGDQADIVVNVSFEETKYARGNGLRSVKLILKTLCGTKKDGLSFGLTKGAVSGDVTLIRGSERAHKKDYTLDLSYLIYGKEKPKIVVDEKFLRTFVWGYKEDKDDFTTEQIRIVQTEWWYPLLEKFPALADAIKQGRCMLAVDGFASTTGNDRSYNLTISQKRANSVVQGLKKIVGPNVACVVTPHGDVAATQTGPADQEKRVEISISKATAEMFVNGG